MSAIGISNEDLKGIIQSKDTLAVKGDAMTATKNKVIAPMVEISKNRPSQLMIHVNSFFKWLIPPVFGLLMLLVIWTLISHHSPN